MSSMDYDPNLDMLVPRQRCQSRTWPRMVCIGVGLLLTGCATLTPQARTALPSPTRPPVVEPANTIQPSPTRPLVAPTVEITATPRETNYPVRPAGLSRGRVVRVVDGDTVDVMVEGGEDRVRLIGFDAPETHSPNEPVQCFGADATHRAEQLLAGQEVWVELDPTQGVRDRYGRLLAYLWLADGRLFNLEMISEGYAFEYTYNRPYKYQAEFQQAERNAQARQAGLWSPQTCNGGLIPATTVPGSQVPEAVRGAVAVTGTLQIETIRAAGGDEVVTIVNPGPYDQTLAGWWIQSAGGKTCQPVPGQVFHFPAAYVLTAGSRVRVHSGPQAFDQPPGDLFWQVDTVWNNDGDRAELVSPEGVVAVYAYGRCQ